jgi:AcrR family transcriptional regulator
LYIRAVSRRYQSPLREAQAEQTRQNVLEQAAALLEEAGIEALTIPEVARRAGVSAPTAYRYFPTVDDLLAAVLAWLRPQIGMQPERLLGSGIDVLHELPGENFPRFEQHARLLEAVMDSPSWNRIRTRSMTDRADRGAEVLSAARPDADLRSRRIASAAIYALASPITWRWMRETWGLDADEAREAAAWGMEALVAAFRAGSLPDPKKSTRRKRPAKTRKRAKT